MPVRLAFERFGQGEPLFILHGLFGSRRNWLSLAKLLSRHVQVIAVDLRNHGDSEHAPTMGFAEMAADVAALADELGIGHINVAGHSMGGKVAMMLALNHPQRTRRLVVLDVAPVRYAPGFDGLIAAMRALPLERIGARAEAEELLARDVADPALCRFLLHNLVRDAGGFRWRINLEAIGANLDQICDFPKLDAGAAFEGPARFIGGDRSDYLLPGHEYRILELFPRAGFHTIKGAGHWLHSDRPEAVVSQLLESMRNDRLL
jgi:esterase